MSGYWSWWQSGLALTAVMVGHWLVMRRMMAVSGRYTALVDRLRIPRDEPAVEMTPEEIAEALRALTAAEFGEDALEAPPPAVAAPTLLPPLPMGAHLVFFGGLVLGGLLSALLSGGLSAAFTLRGAHFAAAVGHSPIATPLVLLGGGMLVGFGTRMAAGCTSGHGLCGTSRFQPGSLLATLAFFATGVGASFLLGRLM